VSREKIFDQKQYMLPLKFSIYLVKYVRILTLSASSWGRKIERFLPPAFVGNSFHPWTRA
jgi:hypothetical protein